MGRLQGYRLTEQRPEITLNSMPWLSLYIVPKLYNQTLQMMYILLYTDVGASSLTPV